MCFKPFFCFIGLTGTNRFGNRLMLQIGPLCAPRLVTKNVAAKKMESGNQTQIDFFEHGILRTAGKHLMNFEVELRVTGDIFGVHGLSHLLHNAFERSFLGRSSPLGCQTSDQAFKRFTQFVDLFDLLKGEVSYPDASVFLTAHQSPLFQNAEGLTHRTARKPHLRRNIRFPQRLSGRHFALCNPAFEL